MDLAAIFFTDKMHVINFTISMIMTSNEKKVERKGRCLNLSKQDNFK